MQCDNAVSQVEVVEPSANPRVSQRICPLELARYQGVARPKPPMCVRPRSSVVLAPIGDTCGVSIRFAIEQRVGKSLLPSTTRSSSGAKSNSQPADYKRSTPQRLQVATHGAGCRNVFESTACPPICRHTTRESGRSVKASHQACPRGHDVDQVIVEPSGVEYVEMARCGPGVVERPSVNRLARS